MPVLSPDFIAELELYEACRIANEKAGYDWDALEAHADNEETKES